MPVRLLCVLLTTLSAGCQCGLFCVQEEVTCTTTCEDVQYECSGIDGHAYGGSFGATQFQCAAGRCPGMLAAARAACADVARTLVRVRSTELVNDAFVDRVTVCPGDALPAGDGPGATGGGTTVTGGGAGGGSPTGGGVPTGGGSPTGGGGGVAGGPGGGTGSGLECSGASALRCLCGVGAQPGPDPVLTCSESSIAGRCCADSTWPSSGFCECAKFRCYQRDSTTCECILGQAALFDDRYTQASCTPAPGRVCCLEDRGISGDSVCWCGRTSCPAGVQQVSACTSSVDVCAARQKSTVDRCL